MIAATGKGHTAVRNQRRPRVSEGEPWQKLDLFPTPPWATRALPAIILPELRVRRLGLVREPCAGLRHMADPLAEYADDVYATDVYLYDRALDVVQQDFLSDHEMCGDEWIITNPPFKTAEQIAQIALQRASVGVALLLRFNWLEGGARYRNLFSVLPPSLVAVFSERVPICEGGWDPDLSSATCYAWFVWVRDRDGWQRPARAGVGRFDGFIVPPVCAQTLSRPRDRLLAMRHVPGWTPPSKAKTTKFQQSMEFA